MNWNDGALFNMASVCLIYPKPEVEKKVRFGFSLNILYIAAILKKANHSINLIDLSLMELSDTELFLQIEDSKYIIIELDAFPLNRSSNVINGERMIHDIKTMFPDKIIIAFGYDIDLFKRSVPFSDYSISINEIENNILNIIDTSTPFINYLESTDTFDQLPLPERSLLTNLNLVQKNYERLAKSTLIQTSRGCLNSCRFCQRQGWNKGYISHSIDYVIDEFKYLQDENYINIWINDDNFTWDLLRAKRILQRLIDESISENMKICCSSWTKIDKEFLLLAKKANISIISFGIESTSPEILEYYKKNINLKSIEALIKYANEIGLYTVGNFIIGAPMETEDTTKNTFDFALNTPFDQINIKILDFMIGSELYNTLPNDMHNGTRHYFACKENGLNNFTLNELSKRINDFKQIFDKNRNQKIKQKILQWGYPYSIMK